jgi:hypothetical protein
LDSCSKQKELELYKITLLQTTFMVHTSTATAVLGGIAGGKAFAAITAITELRILAPRNYFWTTFENWNGGQAKVTHMSASNPTSRKHDRNDNTSSATSLVIIIIIVELLRQGFSLHPFYPSISQLLRRFRQE